MPVPEERLREIDAALDALGAGMRRRGSRGPRPPFDLRDLPRVDTYLAELGAPGRASRPAAAPVDPGVVPEPSLPAPPTAPSDAVPAPPIGPSDAFVATPSSAPPAADEAPEDAPPTDLELRVQDVGPSPSEPPITVPRDREEALSPERLAALFGEDPDDPTGGSAAGPLPSAPTGEAVGPDALDAMRWDEPTAAVRSPSEPVPSSLPDAASLWPAHTVSSASRASDDASEAPRAPSDAPIDPTLTEAPGAPTAHDPTPEAAASAEAGLHDFAPTPIRPLPSAAPPGPLREASMPPPVPGAELEDELAELDDLLIVEPESEPAATAPAAAEPRPPSSAYDEALDDLLDFTDGDVESVPASVPSQEAIERATSVAPSAPPPGERGDPSVEISVEEDVLSEDSVVAAVELAPDSVIEAPVLAAPSLGEGGEDAAVDETVADLAPPGDGAEGEAPGDEDGEERKGFFSRLFGRK